MPQKRDFDDADRRLLNALQRNSRRSIAELAEAVGLTVQTCQRRLQNLRDSGVVQSEVVLVDPRDTPRPLTVIVEITLERMTEATRQKFERKVQAVGDIMQCWAVTGAADYIVIAQVSDIEDYYLLVNDVFVNDEAIKSTKTAFCMRRTKFETAIDF
jgi:Lrp/AsnC family leucine-responsive transcriptional regulator